MTRRYSVHDMRGGQDSFLGYFEGLDTARRIATAHLAANPDAGRVGIYTAPRRSALGLFVESIHGAARCGMYCDVCGPKVQP